MDKQTWQQRRRNLRETLPEGVILLLGNNDAPRNYEDNIYPFRQDSHFLYFVGANRPGLALLMLPGGGEILFGQPDHPDSVVWEGPQPGLADLAGGAGIGSTREIDDLAGLLRETQQHKIPIHYLPPYRADNRILLSHLLECRLEDVSERCSEELVAAVVALREIKSAEETREIEYALGMSALMYKTAMNVVRPGLNEARINGMLQGVSLMEDLQLSFPPIISVHGETLHNHSYGNDLESGQLLVIDSGVESRFGYCSDITRTLPVTGVFSPQQKEIYEVVLAAQQTAIEMASPARANRELHLAAAETMARGLTDVGLMRGDPREAVAAGAHALFFPHGLGHMLGLDVHDMEDLGDAVGYDPGESRSSQFGLNFLRLAKQLQPGFVVTIEPGCYFIPALIDRWQAEKKHLDFINYEMAAKFKDFGGIRIEDEILITDQGCRVLGVPIPKTPDDIEVLMGLQDE